MRTAAARGRFWALAVRRWMVVLAAVVGPALLPSSAGAATAVPDSSVTMTSDAGDFIGGGQSYSYVAGHDILDSSGSAGVVHIRVTGFNGDFWSLDFAAPLGQSLSVGTYASATRYPFQGAGPGLSIDGNGRGCNTLTGSFTVSGVSFGPNDYLESFDATFEQHCEGADPALRGAVHIVNPPAPVPLQIGLALDSQGMASRVSGSATVSGQVTCSRPTTVALFGNLTQRASRFALTSGSFFIEVPCTDGPITWRATVSPANGVPFNSGRAQLDASASAFDAEIGQQVTSTQSATVKLVRSR